MDKIAEIKKEQELIHRSNWDWDWDRELGIMNPATEENILKSDYVLGEIVVFLGGWFRTESWISRLRKIHFERPNTAPAYRKATLEEKAAFFECGKYELVIE